MNTLPQFSLTEGSSIKPVTNDEVFIGWRSLLTCLEPHYTKHTQFNATRGLWQAILQNTGVVFAEDESLIDVRPNGLPCVRILGNMPLMSVDGLVDGLANGQFTGIGNNIGYRRLAGIAQLARTFTPDRETEIIEAENTLMIPELGHKTASFHYF